MKRVAGQQVLKVVRTRWNRSERGGERTESTESTEKTYRGTEVHEGGPTSS